MKKVIFYILLLTPLAALADVKLPRLVRDSMVLQRDQKITIWGWADSGEKVTVSFLNKKYSAKTQSSGKWELSIGPLRAGGPHTMTITGKNKITLNQILIGDVWICSGQSNMVHQLNIHDVTYAADIASANYPAIRQFWIPTLTSLSGPNADLPTGFWKSAVGDDVRPFSAVAYFFARALYQEYQVPIGLINASVGGTPIEAWTSEEGLRDFANLQATIQKNKDTAYINSLSRRPGNANNAPILRDKGLTSSPKWFDPAYTPKGWRTINIPGYWEDQGIKDLNGTVWYRREIDVPASMTGKPVRLFLGRIVDADVLYINGRQVGNTTYQYPQRRYNIPADVLKPGKNLFVVKVTNTVGKGGFVPDKPYYFFTATDTIDLKGEWQYKVGEVFEPRTGGFGGGISAQNQPTALFNAMLAPAVKYAVKGFLWYQGESNTGRAGEYAALQAAQIADWRKLWNQPEAPFLYVQLPGFMDMNYLPSESQWAALREAQLKSLAVPRTAMVVAIDLGEWNDIHPDNKKDVGERLALAARNIAYGEKDIVYSGPLYQSASVQGNKIILEFTHTGGGLITNDGEEPAEFAIAGADKKFVWAKARIDGNKVTVWNENVTAPMYVRYAWADNPVNPNLYNREGLPASPFRTDQ